MDQDLQNAIDTVDAARQHKCELEGKLRQLNACISQVSVTSRQSRKSIEQHFNTLQVKVLSQIQQKRQELLDEIAKTEKEALKPLEDCKQFLEEGIQESETVVENGEKLLHSNEDCSQDGRKLKKFTNSTAGLSLSGIPEVPSLTEVASLTFHYKEKDLCQKICEAVKRHGQISRQAPIQITELGPIPGGIVVSWDECNTDEVAEWIEGGNTVLYKLQYCHGKATLAPSNSTSVYSQSHGVFRDAYTGSNMCYRVKKLSPNTAYTFRASRCLVKGNEQDSPVELDWSPWSVYQSGVTTLSGYEWSSVNEREGYNVQDKSRVAVKRSNAAQILYSKTGGYIIGYPITFRIEVEGKSHSAGDGFALVAEMDSISTSIIKEGSLCVTAEGKIFINGVESKTRFCNFCRNSMVRFNAQEIKSDEHNDSGSKRVKSKPSHVVLRVTITMSDKEAVFNWRIPAASVAENAAGKHCLGFAASFKAQGWKFNVI